MTRFGFWYTFLYHFEYHCRRRRVHVSILYICIQCEPWSVMKFYAVHFCTINRYLCVQCTTIIREIHKMHVHIVENECIIQISQNEREKKDDKTKILYHHIPIQSELRAHTAQWCVSSSVLFMCWPDKFNSTKNCLRTSARQNSNVVKFSDPFRIKPDAMLPIWLYLYRYMDGRDTHYTPCTIKERCKRL